GRALDGHRCRTPHVSRLSHRLLQEAARVQLERRRHPPGADAAPLLHRLSTSRRSARLLGRHCRHQHGARHSPSRPRTSLRLPSEGGEEIAMDWKQLWEILSAPDNIPIIAMIPLLAFYIYLAWKQASANDTLIAQLETNPPLAKTHHRKAWPFQPGWAKEVHVWPFLLRIEFLAAIIVTIILMVWSITWNAPLEEPANPNPTMNPANAQ